MYLTDLVRGRGIEKDTLSHSKVFSSKSREEGGREGGMISILSLS